VRAAAGRGGQPASAEQRAAARELREASREKGKRELGFGRGAQFIAAAAGGRSLGELGLLRG